jgi:hypothetical protein
MGHSTILFLRYILKNRIRKADPSPKTVVNFNLIIKPDCACITEV